MTAQPLPNCAPGPHPVFVVGTGHTRFGRFPDLTGTELGRDAILEALEEAGCSPRQVQLLTCGHTRGGSCHGQRIGAEVGLSGVETINVENACASGSTAVRAAFHALSFGMAELALCIGVEQMTARIAKGVIPPNQEDLEGALGRVMPAQFAMVAQRHMARYGTTKEQLALVSVKSRRFASKNPKAQFQKETTVEEVLATKMICEPLTLFMCSAVSDGAAAVVLAAGGAAEKYACGKKVRILAAALGSGAMRDAGTDLSFSEVASQTARRAYEQAGVGPEDVDVAECHDCFAMAEILHYETLGFCPRGEGGHFIEEGKSDVGGDVVFNPSGGLLSKGHPLGATGVAQIAELTRQLRGEGAVNPIEGARVALAHTMGGGVGGIEAGACAVTLLSASF